MNVVLIVLNIWVFFKYLFSGTRTSGVLDSDLHDFMNFEKFDDTIKVGISKTINLVANSKRGVAIEMTISYYCEPGTKTYALLYCGNIYTCILVNTVPSIVNIHLHIYPPPQYIMY